MEPGASFLETIRLEEGRFPFLPYHQNRFDRTRRHFCMDDKPLSLADHLEIPPEYQTGLYKVRVIYRCGIEDVSCQPYTIRPVKTLKLVQANHINYEYKYENRSEIESLFAERGEFDDILMVKNGLLTDTSYANIILSDGQYWYTPARPLMQGTCRARLLESGRIIPTDIYAEHLHDFQEIRLINSMMNFEEGPRIMVSGVSEMS